MKRGSPLRRTGFLKRGTRLAPRSQKTREQRSLERGVIGHVMARTHIAPRGHCEDVASPRHGGPLDCHHVIKRSQGGPTHPDNLVRICRQHHDATDRAFAQGRLVIRALGDERFNFEWVYAEGKWAARL